MEEADALMMHHGRNILHALLCGVASVAPRSTLQNMSEILTQLSSKRTAEVRTWANEILFSVRLQDAIHPDPWLTGNQLDFSERHPKANQAVKEGFVASLLR